MFAQVMLCIQSVTLLIVAVFLCLIGKRLACACMELTNELQVCRRAQYGDSMTDPDPKDERIPIGPTDI